MSKNRTRVVWAVFIGVIAGLGLALGLDYMYTRTSSNETCTSCHYHDDADAKWKKSSHFVNESGTVTDCAACHLPPEQQYVRHFAAKTRTGAKDIFSYLTKKKENIDWARKSELEYAEKIVYNASCKECHKDLYPEGITDDGISAHLYYDEHEQDLGLQCISCHLDVGHYNPNYQHGRMAGLPVSRAAAAEKYAAPATLTAFENFIETIPGTTAAISMVAIPGGSFKMGSPASEKLRGETEMLPTETAVEPFFMGEVEVTWDQYWAFYSETMSEGRTPPELVYRNNSRPDCDAITGPTPPFGNPDQGWGAGERPAITMTHYAAETFCQWLSLKTGRHYRLPTEAEWEYAARAGTEGEYFFGGKAVKYTSKGFMKGIFKPDTTIINTYAIYELNSGRKTRLPSEVKANPFGLRNMAGNVMEYCSDKIGDEYAVRGGCYADDAALLRSAARATTRHSAWLKTDPQNPKSIWWYSDIKGIGFRVVCDVPENIIP